MGGLQGVQEASGDRAENGRRRAVVRRPRRRRRVHAGPHWLAEAADAPPPPPKRGVQRRSAAALPLQAGAGVPSPSAQPRRLLAAASSVGGEPQASSRLHCRRPRQLQPPAPVPRRGHWVHHPATGPDDGGRRLHGRLGHRLESARQVRRVSALQPRRRHSERGRLLQSGAGVSG